MIKIRDLPDMQCHPAAELFPMMAGADLKALVADIREHGQREPIIVYEGLILDGRNRYRACQELAIKPETMDWTPNGTPEAYVISMNLHRRHLSESQRAMIAAKLANIKVGEVGQHRKKLGRQISRPQAAQMLNVSESSVGMAKTVLAKGTPEEISAVERGEIGASTIAREILKSQSPEKRRKRRDEPMSQRGRNVERIQRSQMHAEIWARLSDALIGLTSLPIPSDVVEIIATNQQRSRVVDDRLSRSLNWIKGFENAWRNRG